MRGKKISRTLGTTLMVVAAVLMVTLIFTPGTWAASKFKTLYKFKGNKDGKFPYAGLVFDPTGNLYGTTKNGGVYRCGTVFQLTPNGDGSWTERVLYSFNGTDGSRPDAGLILDQAGNLYGTTESGGAYSDQGTVFQLTPNLDGGWTENVLHSFDSNPRDGVHPYAGVIFDSAGNLYGTTQYGGAYGYGTVFQLTPNGDGSWTESLLYSFKGPENEDGQSSWGPLLLDSAGNLYGTTRDGGTHRAGTVFQLIPNGDGSWTESVIHSFIRDGKDGDSPIAGLTFDRAGNLYGTTSTAGTYGVGTIFKLAPKGGKRWAESVLHMFHGSDGSAPNAGLIFDRAGNLYGTTYFGGSYDRGTVFKLKHTAKGGWQETVLHSFKNHPGEYPNAGMIFDAHGSLYGTTTGGGTTTLGSVFEITP